MKVNLSLAQTNLEWRKRMRQRFSLLNFDESLFCGEILAVIKEYNIYYRSKKA